MRFWLGPTTALALLQSSGQSTLDVPPTLPVVYARFGVDALLETRAKLGRVSITCPKYKSKQTEPL